MTEPATRSAARQTGAVAVGAEPVLVLLQELVQRAAVGAGRHFWFYRYGRRIVSYHGTFNAQGTSIGLLRYSSGTYGASARSTHSNPMAALIGVARGLLRRPGVGLAASKAWSPGRAFHGTGRAMSQQIGFVTDVEGNIDYWNDQVRGWLFLTVTKSPRRGVAGGA